MKTFFRMKFFLVVMLLSTLPFPVRCLQQPTTAGQRVEPRHSLEQIHTDTQVEECPICLEKKGLCSTLKESGTRKVFSCTHWICEECFKQVQSLCPVCRAPITESAPSLDNYLWHAVKNNEIEKARKYIRRGAHPDITDRFGKTTLITAVWNRHMPMAKALILGGANVNAQERHGFAALHKASIEGYASFADFLLEHGARIDLQDNEGNTALHYAVANDHKKIIELLIRNNAHIMRNKFGQTALEWAEAAGNVPVVQKALAARK